MDWLIFAVSSCALSLLMFVAPWLLNGLAVAVLTDTPWPPAIRVWVASARGGESPTLGGGAEGGDARASAAKVCTSAARKTAGNPLHARGAKLLHVFLQALCAGRFLSLPRWPGFVWNSNSIGPGTGQRS